MTIRRGATRISGRRSSGVARLARWVLVGIPLFFIAIQLVPYGRNHADPPVIAEPQWDSPRTRQLAMQACFACHSNQTTWPWYTNVAPASWLTQRHVDEGRRILNFSVWNQPQRNAAKAARTVESGQMPPKDYLLLHPEARLSSADRRALIAGLSATFGTSAGGASVDTSPDLLIRVAEAARTT
jgi:mono/diheme cytochrome c family protein